MRHEQTDGPLYDLGTRLFVLVEHLTGERPDFRSGQWHTARWHGRPFLWCQFVGGSATSYHPHSRSYPPAPYPLRHAPSVSTPPPSPHSERA